LARSQSTAASISPLVAARAALQSIMPTPVDSRKLFTMPAVISAMIILFQKWNKGPR
jgi:hypothetical protein